MNPIKDVWNHKSDIGIACYCYVQNLSIKQSVELVSASHQQPAGLRSIILSNVKMKPI